MWLTILSTIFGFFGIFYFWTKWKHSYWQRKGVPSLPTNFLFGNIMDSVLMRISPPILLGRLHNRVKGDPPFLGVYIMHKPFLLVRSPEMIKQILIKDFNVFSDRYFASNAKSDSVGNRGLFSIKNPEWRYLRTKLSPAFTSGKIKSLFNLMLESAESLKNHIDDTFNDDKQNVKTMEFKDASAKFTTDVISSLAFGVRTNSFEKPSPEFYQRSRSTFKQSIINVLQLFTVFFFPSITKYVRGSMLGKNTDYFRKVFWNSMNSRENGKYERGDVIDSLVKLKNEKQETDFKFQGDTLVAQSAIFFVAGLETSATTMAFTLWELAKNPEIQERVRRDINDQLETRGMTYESVLDMKYLTAVINETLRMYPPAPIIDRVANREYKIPGSDVTLEKGTVVYVILPGIHMDPENHPEPERYDPDRFSEERKNDMKPCTFMPFGEGPRACIGLRVGMLQTAVGLITILRNHQVSINPAYKNGISKRSIFMTPANGIMLDIKKIQSD